MRDNLVLLGAAGFAVACCFGLSLAAAAGATTLLGLAGVAVPAAA